ncbi:MAG: AAA family ATPase [Candidatus Latescibacterota bacterium]
MLRRLAVRGFKSLQDVDISLPRMAVLLGPNAAGKSNFLDAVQALSRIGTQRTLADALTEPIRGYPVEALLFPPGGLPELLASPSASFTLEADLTRERDAYRYRIKVQIAPGAGTLTVADEYLSPLSMATLEPKGTAAIEQKEGKLSIRRKSHPGRPRLEATHQNYAIVSDPRLAAPEYRDIERARAELSGRRTYYLDPRVAMRAARPPSDVRDIGVLGGDIAPFLYRLRAEKPEHF